MKVVIVSALWCQSCLFMRKHFKTWMSLHPEIEFVQADLDLDEPLIESYGPFKVLPTVLLFRDDHLLDRWVGEKSVDEMEKSLAHAQTL